MIAYLINPRLQRIHNIELPDHTSYMLAEMRKLIGAETLDSEMISDMHDQLWCDDGVFSRGHPCFAFRLRGHNADMGPYGGTCIIIGNDRYGRSRPPFVPIEMIENDIDWLGEIIPEVTQVTDVDRYGAVHIHLVLTYKRPS